MRFVFLDTVGLIAMWNRTDQWHAAAKRAAGVLNAPGTRLLTSSFVLIECGNAAARRPFRGELDALRRQLETDKGLIVPNESDWTEAWAAFADGKIGDAGIVDHVSFIIMRRLGITDVFTNDRHFAAAGFNTLF